MRVTTTRIILNPQSLRYPAPDTFELRVCDALNVPTAVATASRNAMLASQFVPSFDPSTVNTPLPEEIEAAKKCRVMSSRFSIFTGSDVVVAVTAFNNTFCNFLFYLIERPFSFAIVCFPHSQDTKSKDEERLSQLDVRLRINPLELKKDQEFSRTRTRRTRGVNLQLVAVL